MAALDSVGSFQMVTAGENIGLGMKNLPLVLVNHLIRSCPIPSVLLTRSFSYWQKTNQEEERLAWADFVSWPECLRSALAKG